MTAVLACGAIAAGAIAIAAATASGHAAAMAASPAAYSARSSSEGAVLNSALGNWNSSRQATYSDLASLTQVQGYSQTRHQGQTLDIQRGIVVLATSNYLILQSANGSLHLWLLSGATKVQDVTGMTAGTMALTASTSATQQAMASGNMIPATTLLAGSPVMAAAMLTPTRRPGDGIGAGGQHRSHRDRHRDPRYRGGLADRDHPGHRGADPRSDHVHPERMAGHRLDRAR